MKKNITIKWTARISIVLIILSLVSCFAVKKQVKQHNGALTELVNPSKFKTYSEPIAIKGAKVLSTDCTRMLDSLTVIIKDGKIINIGKNISISDEYKIIDASGKYLIPGLIDSHAHLHKSKNDLLLYLANGVTYISEMYGQDIHLKWREEAENGALSPNICVASRKVGSQKGIKRIIKSWFGSQHNYTTVKSARKAVKKYKNKGYNAIKFSSFINEDIYQALVDEGKKQEIPTIGHLPYSISLKKFLLSGQSQLAHIEEITKATMTEFGGLRFDNSEEYLAYLKKNADSIAKELKQKNIIVSSTIWLMESIPKQNFDLKNFLKIIELEYQNPGQIEGSKFAKGWLPGNNSYENMDIKDNIELTQKHKFFWDTYVEAIYIMGKALVNNDVTITAGTDSNSPGIIAGFSLHDELQSLRKIGMSNSQILYSTMVAPSYWMKTNTGKIETDYDADLVLLNKNPLENINNTRSINTVIINGKYLDREQLDKMLQAVKDANNRSRKVNIDEYVD